MRKLINEFVEIASKFKTVLQNHYSNDVSTCVGYEIYFTQNKYSSGEIVCSINHVVKGKIKLIYKSFGTVEIDYQITDCEIKKSILSLSLAMEKFNKSI